MGTYETVWRAFEENEISHSAAHYLLAIHSFLKIGLEPKSADLARMLKVSRAAVSLQLKSLSKQNWVELSNENRVLLSKKGTDLVARIVGSREIVHKFLAEILLVSDKTAELDGCKVEHLISEETVAAIDRLNAFLKSGNSAAENFMKEFQLYTKKMNAEKRRAVRSGR